jgi:hypothetical protein
MYAIFNQLVSEFNLFSTNLNLFFFGKIQVTIISSFFICILLWSEFCDYRTPEMRPELVVDKSRNQTLEININITLPHVPCYCKCEF